MEITRRLEFDAGHRIPWHDSQCKHLHGHRYALEISLGGALLDAPGDPEHGMVLDFHHAKRIAKTHIVDPWDHAFLVYKHDTQVVDFLASIPEHKTVILDNVPTVEVLAATAFSILTRAYSREYGNRLQLTKLRLYETPNNWAELTNTNCSTLSD